MAYTPVKSFNALFIRLGEYLREKRIASGLSQAEVSKAMGYRTSQFISNCERGRCPLPMKTLRELVDLYNIPFSELIELLIHEQRIYLEQKLARKLAPHKRNEPKKSKRA